MSRLSTSRSAVAAVAVSAILVAIAGPTAVASAARMITGESIANGTVAGRDLADEAVRTRTIRDGAIRSEDLRNGTIGRVDLDDDLRKALGGGAGAGAAGATGATGATGPAGERGPAGADGTAAAAESGGVATWTLQHVADGSTSFSRTSSQTIPAGAVIEPIDLDLTGDFSLCTWGSGISFTVAGTNQLLVRSAPLNPTSGAKVTTVSEARSVDGPARNLRVSVDCSVFDTAYAPSYTRAIQTPTFDASLTFKWALPDVTDAQPFQ